MGESSPDGRKNLPKELEVREHRIIRKSFTVAGVICELELKRYSIIKNLLVGMLRLHPGFFLEDNEDSLKDIKAR